MTEKTINYMVKAIFGGIIVAITIFIKNYLDQDDDSLSINQING